MSLPGGIQVRYKCLGCGHTMDTDEHMRNFTTDKIDTDGITATMTVILCDECKPMYDDLRKQHEDVLSTIQAWPKEGR